jgi:hypothetical protein
MVASSVSDAIESAESSESSGSSSSSDDEGRRMSLALTSLRKS